MMRRRPLAPIVWLPVALLMAPAVPASAAANIHIVNAAGAGVCSFPPCTDDHREGQYSNGGVPGLNDYSYYDGLADSAYGIMRLDRGFGWLQGASAPLTFPSIGDVLEESVVLSRIAPGPVTVRATMDLDMSASVMGPSALVRVSGRLSFAGCEAYVSQEFSPYGSEDPNTIAGACAEAGLGALTVTSTFDGDLPTDPVLYAALLVEEVTTLHKGNVIGATSEGNVRLELVNATATWTTPSFLTKAPEPGDDALGIVAIGTLVARGARSRRRG